MGLGLSACASLKPAQLPLLETTSGHLAIQNLRDASESETEGLSYLVTSCQYGIDRLGDEWVRPNKVDYLARSISQQLPDGKQLPLLILSLI